MSNVEYIATHHFPTAECGLASLSMRVDELAARLGFTVHSWRDDGLGPARGFACRLPSGLVFVMVEHLLSIEHSYSRGPLILVDATDLSRLGVEHLLKEILQALNLSRTDVASVADRSSELEAEGLVAQFDAFSHGSSGELSVSPEV
jgi:hypothetical protein